MGKMVQNAKDIRFKELLTCNVKRLTRPKFNHEFTQFNDPVAFANQIDDGEADIAEKKQSTEKFAIEKDYDP